MLFSSACLSLLVFFLTSSMSQVIRVDDADARVRYTGQWFPGGQPPQEYNGTTHGAISNGSTLSFAFKGTNVALYGTVAPVQSGTDNKTTTALYVLDDATPVTLTAPASLTTQYGFPFYKLPPLSDEQHTLVVTATDVVPLNTLWVDYIEFVPSNSSSISSVTSPSSTASLSGSAPPASPSNGGESADNGIHHHRGGDHSGTIVAAVLVPIIVLLVLAIAGLFFWWRRRFARLSRAQGEYDKEGGMVDQSRLSGCPDAYIVNPYTVGESSASRVRFSKEAVQVPQEAVGERVISTAGQSRAAVEPEQEPPPAYVGA